MTNQKETDWLLSEKYHGQKSAEFEADVERLEKGEPLAYVIGWVSFFGTTIDLSLRPLIPRPETEFLVERAIAILKESKKEKLRLADTFSGSGCIGIALLTHLPSATVEFSEYDPKLLEQIHINLKKNNIATSRAKVTLGDRLSALSGTYDAIFANPPYIDPSVLSSMEKSVSLHEPHLALFAGKGGLDHIKSIIADGQQFLNDGGTFFIECDPEQEIPIKNLLIDTTWQYTFWKDQYEKIRFLILEKS